MRYIILILLSLTTIQSFAGCSCCGPCSALVSINSTGFSAVTAAVVDNTAVLLGAIEANTYAVDRGNMQMANEMNNLIVANDVARSQSQQEVLTTVLEKFTENRVDVLKKYGTLTTEACAHAVASKEVEKNLDKEIDRVKALHNKIKQETSDNKVDPNRGTFSTASEENLIQELLATDTEQMKASLLLFTDDLHWDANDLTYMENTYMPAVLDKDFYPDSDGVAGIDSTAYTDTFGPYEVERKKLEAERVLTRIPFEYEKAMKEPIYSKTDLEAIEVYKNLLDYLAEADDTVKNAIGLNKSSSESDKLSNAELIELFVKANLAEPDKVMNLEIANDTDLLRAVNYNLAINNYIALQQLKFVISQSKALANLHDHKVHEVTGNKVKTIESSIRTY